MENTRDYIIAIKPKKDTGKTIPVLYNQAD